MTFSCGATSRKNNRPATIKNRGYLKLCVTFGVLVVFPSHHFECRLHGCLGTARLTMEDSPLRYHTASGNPIDHSQMQYGLRKHSRDSLRLRSPETKRVSRLVSVVTDGSKKSSAAQDRLFESALHYRKPQALSRYCALQDDKPLRTS